MEPIIEIRDLKKVYKQGDVDVHALRGLDLTVEPGEFVSIVGPSGCGKSTLFNILGGLTPPTAGSVRIKGQDLLAMTDSARTDLRKKMVGFVFQKYNLLPTLTVEDNIEIARAHRGRLRQAEGSFIRSRRSTCSVLRTRLEPQAQKQLSGGEQQRVAIARAMSIIRRSCWRMSRPAISTPRIRNSC